MTDWPEEARVAAIKAVDKRAAMAGTSLHISVAETMYLTGEILDAVTPILEQAVRERIAREQAVKLPTAAKIQAWLIAHGWTRSLPGVAGTLWTPPDDGPSVGVPHDDEDTMLTTGAIARIADRTGRTVDEVRGEMLALTQGDIDA